MHRWILLAQRWWPFLVAVVAVAFACAILWLWRRRAAKRSRPRGPLAPRYPIVLAHGLMGFDVIRLAGREAEYFRGVPKRLRRMGIAVHSPPVPPLASIAKRAEALAECVRSIDAKRVNVIAHSLGGLDARYAIAKLGLSNRIASLVTIGTPHRGTPVADVGANLMGDKLGLRKALELLGLDVGAFFDITTKQMTAFNDAIGNVRNVAYGSYEASINGKLRRLNPLLLAPYLFLSEQHGANDGLVPATSQRWGDVWGAIDADHWAQIGWSGRFDAPKFYADVARELRARGF